MTFLRKRASLIICILAAALILAGACMCRAGKAIERRYAGDETAENWDPEGGAATVSVYFSENEFKEKDDIETYKFKIAQALKDAGFEISEEAYPFKDSYSAYGSIELGNGLKDVKTVCYGVGGDFFYFHPLKMLSGSYFADSNVNDDFVILDETTAWQLFGSNDIAGKYLWAGDKMLYIKGVYEIPEGSEYKAAGMSGQMVFTSFDTLQEFGSTGGIGHYEIVMPNPIRNFAKKAVGKCAGLPDDYFDKEEEDGANSYDFGESGAAARCIVNDSTSRFSLSNLFKIYKSRYFRSMNGNAIIYPYWENLARYAEDRSASLRIPGTGFVIFGTATLAILLYLFIRRNYEIEKARRVIACIGASCRKLFIMRKKGSGSELG